MENKTYSSVNYLEMTCDEHCERLKKILAVLLMYSDTDTFARVFKYEQDDYILYMFRELKQRGMV